MIKIHYNDTFLEVQESDSSYRYRSLMRKTQLVLKYSLPEYIEIPVGAWCEFQGQKFFLMSSQDFKKNGTRDIEYTLTMYDDEARLGLYKLRNPIDRRLKFSMCAKPHEFLEVIVAYMNERDSSGVWKVGTCIDAPEKTIEFNHTYCDEALQRVADVFETEYENNNHTISLRKVEYFKEDPLPLAYGRGNGFMPGVGRTTQSNELPIKRLYVQGGEQNIDRSKYGSAELLLPKNQTLEYEGRTYKSDAEGYYIERYDKVSDAVKDDSLDCSEIYPSRVGKVSSVECINAEKNFYDFIDLTIPEDLNFNDYIIEGETPYIRFQTGMLSGEKEFEFTYKHAERRFEIVPQEIDGVIMPNETFKPEAGVDTYAVFGINLPYDSEYVCDNKTQRGASWDMFREAARYLYEHEDQKFTFSGTLQSLWARRNWANVGGRLIVGGYILFTDNQFAKDGISIRIVGVKDFLTSPYSPTIEISNSVSGSSLSSQLKEIQNQEVLIDDTKKSIIRFTKRRFRDAQETMEMLEDSLLNFSNSINPITVQTMAALVGDESLQFRFVSSRTNLTQVNFQVDYNNETKQLSCPHSFLQHMTIGISSISSTHASNEYKIWEMSEFLSAVLDDASKKYYLYAKVSRDNTSEKGVFLLSEKSIALDDVSGYYHLLVGVLNSEYEGERSYVSLYGFTEILPGRITTDKIVSGNGESFFDMVANSMKLGDVLDFNTQGDGKLRLKGTLVQSQSGIEAPMGVYRGAYNSGYTYYQGDEVSYFDGNFTSTYRCTSATPIKGIVPTNTSYWEVIAQGSKGDDGVGINTVEEFYLVSSSATGVTTSTSGWKTTLQTTTADKRYLWNYEKITYSNSETVSSTPQVIGMYSEDGRGIKSITEYYQRSTSGSTAPTSWLTSPPALTSTYKYLWNYEVVTYTDDTTSQTEAAVIGIYGDKGDDGVAGDYYEYRYAVNGSTSTPPSLSNTSRNPRGWITSVLSVGNLQYLWQIVAKISGENDSLLTNWSTPVRITPYDGKDGAKGESPAMIFRGPYNSSKLYYGNNIRLDCVKYGSEYYIARIDADTIAANNGTTFKDKLPTDTNYWNTFGASFESIATDLLLAENANIAGWIYRNSRMESQTTDSNGNPMAYLDGVKGSVRLKGTIQHSTGTKGNYSDVDIFFLPAITSDKSIGMGCEIEDIGKVCRLFNSSPFGGASYKVSCNEFVVSKDGFWTSSSMGGYVALVKPQEIVEMTCFAYKDEDDTAVYGRWEITSRFNQESFNQSDAKGRFPRALAIGRIGHNGSAATLSGYWYDGRSLSSVLSLSRSSAGVYNLTMKNGETLPSGCIIFCTGQDTACRYGTISNLTTSGFTLTISDDSSANEGYVNIMILDPYWWYNMN